MVSIDYFSKSEHCCIIDVKKKEIILRLQLLALVGRIPR